jgi:predicted dehydrogenase
MNRRTFLGAISAAGAASAQDKNRHRVRAALLGTQHSHAAGKLRTMLSSPDYDVACVCEPDPKARAEREADPTYRGVRWASEQELLSDPSIQVVVVECAVWDAIPLGRKVVAAGKHLHLEKPPTDVMPPFRSLIEEARSKKLVLQMGYIWRFHEGIAAAMEAARKGWLGDVYMMRGTINTDVAEEARLRFARYRGGIMFELGSHQIDRAVDLWGRPKAVRSWLRHDTGAQDRLADNTLAVLEYEKSLAVITCAARMAGQSEHRSYELLGTDGTFVIQPVEPGTSVRVSMRTARGPYRAGWQEIEMPRQNRFAGDFRDLAHSIQTGEPLKYSYDYELLLQETLLRVCDSEA